MDHTPLGLSITDASRLAGIGRTKLYDEIRKGRLTARKIGNRTIITRSDLTAWLGSLPALTPEAA